MAYRRAPWTAAAGGDLRLQPADDEADCAARRRVGHWRTHSPGLGDPADRDPHPIAFRRAGAHSAPAVRAGGQPATACACSAQRLWTLERHRCGIDARLVRLPDRAVLFPEEP